MDVVSTSLEALILKATQERLQAPDQAALDAFCAVMRDTAEGPALAARALAARVQTGSPRESLLALTALDRCMRRGDPALLAEIGKFRFLNEMIKLVSPKYYAVCTAPEVQQRILQLLHAWATEYPKESKFKVAFEMLRSQGVVKETPPPLPPDPDACTPPRRRVATFEDEEKSKRLQKLLQSKNPKDLQYANMMIKAMVRNEERRTEADSQRALEVRKGRELARLLGSLLEQAAGAGEDEWQLMAELQQASQDHTAVLVALGDAAENEDSIEELVQTISELSSSIETYYKLRDRRSAPPDPTADLVHEARRAAAAGSLVDLSAAGGERAASTGDAELLRDIFSVENGAVGADLLKPVSLVASEAECGGGAAEAERSAAAGLATLDSLGADLLQRLLPGGRRGESFAGKSSEKIPMNAIEKSSPPLNPPHPPAAALDFDFLLGASAAPGPATAAPCAPAATAALDDLMLDISIQPNLPDYNGRSIMKGNQISNGSPQPKSLTDLDRILNSNNATVIKQIDINSTNDGTTKTINLKDFNSILNLKDLKKPPNPNEMPSPANTNVTLDNLSDVTIEKKETLPKDVYRDINSEVPQKVEVHGLSDIDVSLACVQASTMSPLTILDEEEGLTIVLHVAKNRPRPDVNVLVFSTTSRHKSPVSDYKFHAVAPKGCKVRMLAASGECLPPHSAFLQPAAIIQLALVARPPPSAAAAAAPLALKFVATYACGGDALTEVGEVPPLHLHDV